MRGFLLCTFVSALLFSAFAWSQTAITPVSPTETSNESAFTAVDTTNGNSVYNPAGDVILIISNDTAGSATTATIAVQNSSVAIPGFGTVTKSSATCALAAGEKCVIGPFPPVFWNDGNSRLQITYSGDAGGELNLAPIKP